MSLLTLKDAISLERRIRAEIGKVHLKPIGDLIQEAQDAFLKCYELKSQARTNIIIRSKIIETLFDVVLEAPEAPKVYIYYTHVISALQMAYESLYVFPGTAASLKRTYFTRWIRFTQKLWQFRDNTVNPRILLNCIYRFGSLCRGLCKNPEFYDILSNSDDFTIPLLAYYWKNSRSMIPRLETERAIFGVVYRQCKDVGPIPPSPRLCTIRLISSLEEEFGPNSEEQVVKILSTVTPTEADQALWKTLPVTSGFFAVSIIGNWLDPENPAQYRYANAIMRSRAFWKTYTWAIVEEVTTETAKHQFHIHLLFLQSMMKLGLRKLQFDSRELARSIAKSSLFDYMDLITSLALEKPGIYDISTPWIIYIFYYLSTAVSSNRRAFAQHMPRWDLIHRLWIPCRRRISEMKARPEQGMQGIPEEMKWQLHCARDIFRVQDAVRTGRSCTRRGCEARATYACVACYSRYCSSSCQSADWGIHKGVCRDMADLRWVGGMTVRGSSSGNKA